jgi:hypothetical protein
MPLKTLHAFTLVVGLVSMTGIFACESASSPGGGAGTDGSTGYAGSGGPVDAAAAAAFLGCTPIKASALAGCRNPDEPSCQTCCATNANDVCAKHSSSCFQGTIDDVSVVVSSYCQSSAGCSSDCTPCASCSTLSEVTLCRLKPASVECDCAHLELGVDPCVNHTSCACKCSLYKAALAACPPP